MKILKAKVNWYYRYDNDPSFKVLVDKLPELVYEETSPDLFVTDTEGIYQVLTTKGDGQGFCGRVITIKMKDGSTRKLKGPYSIGYGYAAEPVLDVLITDKPEVFERGYTFISTIFNMERLEECAEKAGVWLVETFESQWGKNRETNVFPTLRRTPPKGSARERSAGGCRYRPSMNRWRFIYPNIGPWVDVDPLPQMPLHRRSVSDLMDIVHELDSAHPASFATDMIQYAIDIGNLDKMTALVTRGICDEEWEACRLLLDLTTKEVK